MDGFLRIFADQNPIIEVECCNPNCKKIIKVNTFEYYREDAIEVECPHCKKIIRLTDGKKQLENLKKQFKEAGIKW